MGKNKEDIVTVSVRFPRHLHEKLVVLAEQETRSLSQQIVHFVRQALELEKNEVMDKKYKGKERKIQKGDG